MLARVQLQEKSITQAAFGARTPTAAAKATIAVARRAAPPRLRPRGKELRALAGAPATLAATQTARKRQTKRRAAGRQDAGVMAAPAPAATAAAGLSRAKRQGGGWAGGTLKKNAPPWWHARRPWQSGRTGENQIRAGVALKHCSCWQARRAAGSGRAGRTLKYDAHSCWRERTAARSRRAGGTLQYDALPCWRARNREGRDERAGH